MSLDLSLVGLSGFLNTFAGRDLFGKFFQYFCRGLAGLTQDAKDDELGLQTFHKKNKAVFVRIMEARRTTRWLTSINTFLALSKPSLWENEILFRMNQLGMLWWQTLDHVRWLQEVKVINGDSKRMKRISFAGFVLASIAGVLNFLPKCFGPKAEKDENKKKEFKIQLLKHALNVICTAHVSELYLSHEAICGFSGAAVALIDMEAKYPRKMKSQ